MANASSDNRLATERLPSYLYDNESWLEFAIVFSPCSGCFQVAHRFSHLLQHESADKTTSNNNAAAAGTMQVKKSPPEHIQYSLGD